MATVNDASGRPSEAEIQAYERQWMELDELESKHDYAALEQLATSIYENREQPVKDGGLRSRLLAKVISAIGQPGDGTQATRLHSLATRWVLDLLDHHRDELLPESEAEIAFAVPMDEDISGAAALRAPDEKAEVSRGRAARLLFRAFQRLERAADPGWTPGDPPGWKFVKPKFGDGGEQVEWTKKMPSPSFERLPQGLPSQLYHRGRPDPSQIPDPDLRAAYIKAAESNERIEEMFDARDAAQRAFCDLLPILRSHIAYNYARAGRRDLGAMDELTRIFRDFKVDATLRDRILADIANRNR